MKAAQSNFKGGSPSRYDNLSTHKPLPGTRDNDSATHPEDRSQEPAPQFTTKRPDERDHYIERARNGQTFSKGSPVAGVHGVAHPDSESQYAYSIDRGLINRPEGARQHEHNAVAEAEPIHPKTTEEVARHVYKGDTQGGNRHLAQGFGADFGRGSQVRKGQGKQADNTIDTDSGY